MGGAPHRGRAGGLNSARLWDAFLMEPRSGLTVWRRGTFEEIYPMRTLLALCVAVGAAGLSVATPARADVTVAVPGVNIETPYWRGHHSDEWREQREFKESQYNRPDWQRGHCVRDWDGHAYCR